MQVSVATVADQLKQAAFPMHVRVVSRIDVATDVVRFDLMPPEGFLFPAWTPGAHIEVAIEAEGERFVRHYSLMGNPTDSQVWTICVQFEHGGRGGSRALHERVRTGDTLEVRRLANHFPFVEAPSYIFVAGGIGITPIVPLAWEAARTGAPVRLIQTVRSEDRLVDVSDWPILEGVSLEKVISPSPTPLPVLLGEIAPGTAVMACGPGGLLDALADFSRGKDWSFHCERFIAPATTGSDENQVFTVTLAQSGRTLEVPADSSLLDVLLEHGVPIEYSCKEGICSSCETPVLEGEVDHRDHVLDEDERAQNNCMMVCVSRAKGKCLLLDL